MYLHDCFSDKLIVGVIDPEKEKQLEERRLYEEEMERRSAEIDKLKDILPIETKEDQESFEKLKEDFLRLSTEEFEAKIAEAFKKAEAEAARRQQIKALDMKKKKQQQKQQQQQKKEAKTDLFGTLDPSINEDDDDEDD